MLRIAVVEDNDRDRKVITDAIAIFEKEENETFTFQNFMTPWIFWNREK